MHLTSLLWVTPAQWAYTSVSNQLPKLLGTYGSNRGHSYTRLCSVKQVRERPYTEGWGAGGILQGWGAGELHCSHPVHLHRVGRGLYPGALPYLQHNSSTFPIHPQVHFGLNKGTKQDQQAITTHSWPPHLEPSGLVGQCQMEEKLKKLGSESRMPDLKSCALFI